MHEPARIAHDVGILIDQEHVLGLDAGGSVGIAGAVPLSLGRVLLQGGSNIVHVGQLGSAVDDVLCVLGQTGGQGIAIGVSPGAETAGAALFIDGGLDLGQDLLEIAGFLGQVQTQSAGIAHQGRGQVSLDEVTAVFQQLLQQGLGVRVVGAEVSGLLAVLADPLRHLLQDVSLSAGHANVRGGVGSGLFHQSHAKLLAGGLHDRQTAAHGLIGQMAGEGNVHEGIAAQLMSGADDQIAAGHEVVVASQRRSRSRAGPREPHQRCR